MKENLPENDLVCDFFYITIWHASDTTKTCQDIDSGNILLVPIQFTNIKIIMKIYLSNITSKPALGRW